MKLRFFNKLRINNNVFSIQNGRYIFKVIDLKFMKKYLLSIIFMYLPIFNLATANNFDWPVYNGNSAATHYSPVSSINRYNVKKSKIAWSFDVSDAPKKGRMYWMLETNPIIINGVVFIVTPLMRVVALNGRNGIPIWQSKSLLSSDTRRIDICRGLVYWSDGPRKRIIVASVVS